MMEGPGEMMEGPGAMMMEVGSKSDQSRRESMARRSYKSQKMSVDDEWAPRHIFTIHSITHGIKGIFHLLQVLSIVRRTASFLAFFDECVSP